VVLVYDGEGGRARVLHRPVLHRRRASLPASELFPKKKKELTMAGKEEARNGTERATDEITNQTHTRFLGPEKKKFPAGAGSEVDCGGAVR
jgi:hypothetical protein